MLLSECVSQVIGLVWQPIVWFYIHYVPQHLWIIIGSDIDWFDLAAWILYKFSELRVLLGLLEHSEEAFIVPLQLIDLDLHGPISPLLQVEFFIHLLSMSHLRLKAFSFLYPPSHLLFQTVTLFPVLLHLYCLLLNIVFFSLYLLP